MPTLQPGSTSQAFDVDIGQTVSVTPGSGGTMLVEYTTNSETDIRNGSATWQAWTAGTVSTATSDVAMFPLFARVTAYTAGGSYELSGSGLRAVPNQYLAWKSDVVSARDPVSAAAVVGAAGFANAVRAFYAQSPGTKTAIGSSDPADFTETEVGSITIPGGTLSAPGILRISNFWQYTTGAASTKNMITRINGVIVNAPSTATAGNQCSIFEHHVEILTSTSQAVFPSTQIGTNSTNAVTTMNLDVEDEWVITFGARWSDTATDPTAGNVITLLGARVTY